MHWDKVSKISFLPFPSEPYCGVFQIKFYAIAVHVYICGAYRVCALERSIVAAV